MSPYITPVRREAFALLEEELKSTRIDTPGELVYLFCRVADLYVSQRLREFRIMNDVVGALENAKLEFHRKVVANYEKEKELENGTVWGQWGLGS